MNPLSPQTELFDNIANLIEQARQRVRTAVNTAMVYTYYEIGRHIVEHEQKGENRAEYGKAVLKALSTRLTERFGDGWGVTHLKNIRFFYQAYSPPTKLGKHCLPNLNTTFTQRDITESDQKGKQCLPYSQPKEARLFTLSWSHYLVLIRVKDAAARNFYEIECAEQNWSVRQLQRQVNSSLYERLVLSRGKNEVLRLANEGQNITKPADIIKDPITLEFLGLKPDESYTESKLENAIITRMRDFLLEMGKGFLFEARQKRFTFNEEHFYVDLVFYNRLLQCYCLIDLKTDKLTHQDLGQMQMYVNYFNRFVRQPFEKPTIGILLCKEKNDVLVELTLPDEANIYASSYELYLPDKALLQAKVREWIADFEANETYSDS